MKMVRREWRSEASGFKDGEEESKEVNLLVACGRSVGKACVMKKGY